MRIELAGFLMIFVCLGSDVADAQKSEAARVFQKISPSVVLIEDGESSGSGVVIRPDGLILTNFHVASTPLKLTVQATVKEGGKSTIRKFNDVKLLKVATDYDLALLKFDPEGAVLLPAEIRNPEEVLSTGDRCYAVGNPGVETLQLNNSITQGIVSAASREIEGLPYIQFDAAVNPGNSGGALVDEKGRLSGIVTFVADGTQGISFAIPADKIKMNRFVDPVERVGDREKAKRLYELGNRYYLSARLAGDNAFRKELLAAAYVCFRSALAETPNDADLCLKIGQIYEMAGMKASGRAYLEAALAKDPGLRQTHLQLAVALFEEGDIDKAEPLLTSALKNLKEVFANQAGSAAALSMAEIYDGKKQPARVCYLVRWSESIWRNDTPPRLERRRMLVEKSRPKLTSSQLNQLDAKKSGFTWDEMEKFDRGEAIEPEPLASHNWAAALRANEKQPVQDSANPWGTTVEEAAATTPLAVPGKVMEWPVQVEDPKSVKVIDSPEGVSWNAEKAKLIWNVPPDVATGSHKILISHKPSDKPYAYQVVVVEVAP